MIAQLFPGSSEFLIPFAIVATVAFAIVAVVAARREPDPVGTRPYAIYLSLILFVAMFTALFAATAVVSNAVRVPLKDYVASSGSTQLTPVQHSKHAVASGRSSTSTGGAVLTPYDADDQHVAGLVQAGLVVIAALFVLSFHVRRIRDLVKEPRFETSPGRRTYQVYLHAVTFVSMTVLLFAAAAALYGLFRAVAPGTTDQSVPTTVERGDGIAQLVATGFLAIAAYAIFAYHWHRTRTLRGVGPVPPLGRHAVPTYPVRPPEETTPPSEGPPPAPPSVQPPSAEPPPEPPPPASQEPPPPVAPPT